MVRALTCFIYLLDIKKRMIESFALTNNRLYYCIVQYR